MLILQSAWCNETLVTDQRCSFDSSWQTVELGTQVGRCVRLNKLSILTWDEPCAVTQYFRVKKSAISHVLNLWFSCLPGQYYWVASVLSIHHHFSIRNFLLKDFFLIIPFSHGSVNLQSDISVAVLEMLISTIGHQRSCTIQNQLDLLYHTHVSIQNTDWCTYNWSHIVHICKTELLVSTRALQLCPTWSLYIHSVLLDSRLTENQTGAAEKVSDSIRHILLWPLVGPGVSDFLSGSDRAGRCECKIALGRSEISRKCWFQQHGRLLQTVP